MFMFFNNNIFIIFSAVCHKSKRMTHKKVGAALKKCFKAAKNKVDNVRKRLYE